MVILGGGDVSYQQVTPVGILGALFPSLFSFPSLVPLPVRLSHSLWVVVHRGARYFGQEPSRKSHKGWAKIFFFESTAQSGDKPTHVTRDKDAHRP